MCEDGLAIRPEGGVNAQQALDEADQLHRAARGCGDVQRTAVDLLVQRGRGTGGVRQAAERQRVQDDAQTPQIRRLAVATRRRRRRRGGRGGGGRRPGKESGRGRGKRGGSGGRVDLALPFAGVGLLESASGALRATSSTSRGGRAMLLLLPFV